MPEKKPIGSKQLTPRQIELIAKIKVEDNVAIYDSAERIPDWPALKKVMIALGGTWKTRKGFVFGDDVDAYEIVRIARETGEIIDPREAEFFETPVSLADEMAAWLDLQEGDDVLEPSAGMGSLVRAVQRIVPNLRVTVCEPLSSHQKALKALGCEHWGADFMEAEGRPYDKIIMNPPFSRRQDVRHITRAVGMLKPGGRLAAIASAGVVYRDDRIGREFRALIESLGGSIEPNPPKSFEGTAVQTVMIKLSV